MATPAERLQSIIELATAALQVVNLKRYEAAIELLGDIAADAKAAMSDLEGSL